MKKLLSLILVGVMVAGLGACGSAASSGSADASSSDGEKITSVEQLTGKKVGVQQGTTGDLYISEDEEIVPASIERYKSGFEAVQALSQGKIDAVIIDDAPAKTFVNQTEGLTIIDSPYVEEEYAVAFGKDSDLTAQFNSAMADLIAEGTFDAIVNDYLEAMSNNEDAKHTYTTPEGTEYPNGTLVMATCADFPPYEYYEGDKIVGIDAEIAQAICDKLGYELKIEDMNFDSIITSISTGKADFGMAGMTVTEERKESVDFSDPYMKAKQAVIVKE